MMEFLVVLNLLNSFINIMKTIGLPCSLGLKLWARRYLSDHSSKDDGPWARLTLTLRFGKDRGRQANIQGDDPAPFPSTCGQSEEHPMWHWTSRLSRPGTTVHSTSPAC